MYLKCDEKLRLIIVCSQDEFFVAFDPSESLVYVNNQVESEANRRDDVIPPAEVLDEFHLIEGRGDADSREATFIEHAWETGGKKCRIIARHTESPILTEGASKSSDHGTATGYRVDVILTINGIRREEDQMIRLQYLLLTKRLCPVVSYSLL